jgi:hypothetical protein
MSSNKIIILFMINTFNEKPSTNQDTILLFSFSRLRYIPNLSTGQIIQCNVINRNCQICLDGLFFLSVIDRHHVSCLYIILIRYSTEYLDSF